MNQLTIESVQQDFKVWRASKPKKSKIPDYLLDKTLKLLEHYPIRRVVRDLGLSGSQVSAKDRLYKRSALYRNQQFRYCTQQLLAFIEIIKDIDNTESISISQEKRRKKSQCDGVVVDGCFAPVFHSNRISLVTTPYMSLIR